MSAAFPPGTEPLPLPLARRVDEECRRFEAAWQAAGAAGPRPCLEAYLAEAAKPERSALLRELIRVELYYRRRAGDDPQPADYQTRFPALDPEWLARAVAARPDSSPQARSIVDALAASSPP